MAGCIVQKNFMDIVTDDGADNHVTDSLYCDMYPEISRGILLYEYGYIKYAILYYSKNLYFHWRYLIISAITLFDQVCERVFWDF